MRVYAPDPPPLLREGTGWAQVADEEASEDPAQREDFRVYNGERAGEAFRYW